MTPIQLITEGTWDHALFTTYSLSLSFYETQIHKLGLARNGCRDIRIVADADGYLLSLSERQSHRVGNEYRLTPTALPSGVFHPKVIWLAGKELDLLLLGSGNLTFGGFGKNLECLEVIRSDQNPGMFREVASLIQSWVEREDLKFTDTGWMSFWLTRGNEVGRRQVSVTGTPPALVHSTNRSIGDQLLDVVGRYGEVAEIFSLSPFYDPDADGILSLAESLLAPRLTIGLLPGRETSTTFPFRHHRITDCTVSAARFSAPDDKRRLHAKVLEIRMTDGSAFLLTGSVNSTRKSMLTLDNIETGILRHYPLSEERPFEWDPCEVPPSHQSQEFRKAGLGNRVLVAASLTGEGKITGTLISRADPSGAWQATLQRIDGTSTGFSLSVAASGAFSQEMENLELFQHSAGLQLHVSRSEQEGTGWVSVEGLLMAARRGFLNPATLLRLLGEEADESDESELLRYLATSAQRHLPAFSSGRIHEKPKSKGDADSAGKGEHATTLPVDLLVAHEASFSEQDWGAENAQRDDELLNTYMRRIRQNLLRLQTKEREAVEIEEAGDDRASMREEQERERSRKQLVTSLVDFQSQLRSLALRLPAGGERSAALCMWFEVTLPILLRRLNQPEEAEWFLTQWLSHCLGGQRIENSSDILSQHVLGTVLTLAAAELSRTSEPAKRLGRLHEQLEVYCGKTSPDAACDSLDLLDPSYPPLAAEILKDLPTAASLSEALIAIVGTPTTRQQIARILHSADAHEALPEELPILEIQAGKDYLAQVDSGRRPQVFSISTDSTCCPYCRLKLRKVTLLDVERDRFGTCPDCHRFLIASI